MITEKDILFVTTSMNNKWSYYSRELVKINFPDSEHLIVDGTYGWWQVWFKWLELIKDKSQKYIIHLDDDAFITNKNEILKLLNIIDEGDYSIAGIPDGHNHIRGSNPVSINPFFMICNREDVLSAWQWDIAKKFNPEWIEKYKSEYERGFVENVYINGEIKHNMSHTFCDLNFSPWEGDIFYPFFWSILEKGFKIKYLYPNYGGPILESTNPSIEKGSPEFMIHMWFTREWETSQHIGRYNEVEKILTTDMKLKKYEDNVNIYTNTSI